jgi:flagellin-like hook-associated protein FlgL
VKNIVPPFTIDQNTGHLIYNGINLSQFAWREEYNDNISLMGKFGKMIIDMDSDESELYKYPTDYYAKETICANARKALSELIDCGKNALYAAKQFGVDPDAQEYKDLESFVNNLSEYAQQLEREYSKELLGDKRIVENDPNIEKDAEGNIDYDYYNERGITVITVDERANYFSVDTLKEIISGIEGTEEIEDKKGIADLIEEQFVFSDGDEEVTIKPESALANLALEIDIADDVQDAYDAEKSKRAELQIGASQTVGFTLNGLELMGVGKNNVYHVFDKCIRMLRGEMSFDGLKGMITTLQNKQSDTLNLQTKIGSTQNRLELISNRYDSSELNYTQIRSEAEDADMAEALMNFTTAKTVYSAALASGAKMLQISLIDFLR